MGLSASMRFPPCSGTDIKSHLGSNVTGFNFS